MCWRSYSQTLKNQNLTYLWINSLNIHTVCFHCKLSWGVWKYIETKMQTISNQASFFYTIKDSRQKTKYPESFQMKIRALRWNKKHFSSFLLFVFQSNTYRKYLSWLHFDYETSVQESKQEKDQESFISVFVPCLIIPRSN